MRGFCSSCEKKLIKSVCSPTVFNRQKGYCRVCNAEWALKKYHEDEVYREKSKENHRKWCKDQYYNNLQYKERLNFENRKNRYLSKYGITIQQYCVMLEKQNYLCKICKNPEKKVDYNSRKVVELSIDHCHKTGKVRGLLCYHCNLSLGKYEKYKDMFEEYLCGTQ